MKKQDHFFIFKNNLISKISLPFYESYVSAGFPSPADDYLEKKLDLNEHLIKHPAATFFVRVVGDSMIDAHIFSGDILIVDRALSPIDGSIVIALLDGEFTVKRIYFKKNTIILHPENKTFNPIEVTPNQEFEIWGIVTYIIHQAK